MEKNISKFKTGNTPIKYDQNKNPGTLSWNKTRTKIREHFLEVRPKQKSGNTPLKWDRNKIPVTLSWKRPWYEEKLKRRKREY